MPFRPLLGKYSNFTDQFNSISRETHRKGKSHFPLQPERQPGCSFVKHKPRRGKGGAGRSATEPQQATPTKRISPPKTSSRATTHEFALARCLAARLVPRPSLLAVWSQFVGGTDRIPPHGGGLRAVGVGSALPRRRVRAGLRRQVRPPLALLPASSLICLLPGAGVARKVGSSCLVRFVAV